MKINRLIDDYKTLTKENCESLCLSVNQSSPDKEPFDSEKFYTTYAPIQLKVILAHYCHSDSVDLVRKMQMIHFSRPLDVDTDINERVERASFKEETFFHSIILSIKTKDLNNVYNLLYKKEELPKEVQNEN